MTTLDDTKKRLKDIVAKAVDRKLHAWRKGIEYDYLEDVAVDALAHIQQLEAERDAAVALIPRACAYCKWYGTKHGGFHPDCKNPNGCRNVSGISTGWQWRGVQKEDTDA